MPSSVGPAVTQEFKINALPPEAAEDSDLIFALTKLVNEVAEDGLWPGDRVTVRQLPDLPKGHQGPRPDRDSRTPARLPKQTSLVQSCAKG
jgi:hypothetical protein